MSIFIKFFLHLFLILFLTVVTQVGGIVYLISLLVARYWKKDFKYKKGILFLGLYLLTTFLIVPLLAPVFGRERVKNTNNIRPANYVYVLLNRNYVRPALNELLQNVATSKYFLVSNNSIGIRYLDANFPFIDKFPLLPHLSHNDGKKIDLSFIYENEEGKWTNQKKSISGYGAFAEPQSNEFNQTNSCKSKGYWQYDATKFVRFGRVNKHLVFSEEGTKFLLKSILQQKSVGKIFIEPHLKQRLRLRNSKIRFHGCQAVRHDDHIHLQLK